MLWPLLRDALAKAIRVTWAPVGPNRSNATFAWIVMPAMTRSMSLAASRRNGPFGSTIETLAPGVPSALLKLTVWVTATPRVFTCRLS